MRVGLRGAQLLPLARCPLEGGRAEALWESMIFRFACAFSQSTLVRRAAVDANAILPLCVHSARARRNNCGRGDARPWQQPCMSLSPSEFSRNRRRVGGDCRRRLGGECRHCSREAPRMSLCCRSRAPVMAAGSDAHVLDAVRDSSRRVGRGARWEEAAVGPLLAALGPSAAACAAALASPAAREAVYAVADKAAGALLAEYRARRGRGGGGHVVALLSLVLGAEALTDRQEAQLRARLGQVQAARASAADAGVADGGSGGGVRRAGSSAGGVPGESIPVKPTAAWDRPSSAPGTQAGGGSPRGGGARPAAGDQLASGASSVSRAEASPVADAAIAAPLAVPGPRADAPRVDADRLRECAAAVGGAPAWPAAAAAAVAGTLRDAGAMLRALHAALAADGGDAGGAVSAGRDLARLVKAAAAHAREGTPDAAAVPVSAGAGTRWCEAYVVPRGRSGMRVRRDRGSGRGRRHRARALLGRPRRRVARACGVRGVCDGTRGARARGRAARRTGRGGRALG